MHCQLNPDEAVAYGAAAHAAGLSKHSSQSGREVQLIDVTPLSLGIEVVGEVMSVVVKRGTTIPTRRSKMFSTINDDQTTVGIQVYQGERKKSTDNHKLGSFNLIDIPKAPAGEPKLDVEFRLDSDGIVHVSAEERKSGKRASIRIESANLSESEVSRMINEAKEHAAQDALHSNLAGAVSDLKLCISRMRHKHLDGVQQRLFSRLMEPALQSATNLLQSQHLQVEQVRQKQVLLETAYEANIGEPFVHNWEGDDTIDLYGMDAHLLDLD